MASDLNGQGEPYRSRCHLTGPLQGAKVQGPVIRQPLQGEQQGQLVGAAVGSNAKDLVLSMCVRWGTESGKKSEREGTLEWDCCPDRRTRGGNGTNVPTCVQKAGVA